MGCSCCRLRCEWDCGRTKIALQIFGEVVTSEVEEDGSGKAEGVDTIKDAAVAGDGGTEVFDAAVAFDGGHDESARETHQRDGDCHAGSLKWSEGRDEMEGCAEEDGRSGAAEEAFPGFVRTDFGRDGMFAEGLAPDVLEDVVHLNDGDEPEEEFRVFAEVVWDLEREERGRVAHAVDADHSGPLHFGGAFEETFAIAGGRATHGQDQEGVNWNENDEEAVPFRGEKNVVERQDDEEEPEKAAMVTEARGCECDEFAQRPK